MEPNAYGNGPGTREEEVSPRGVSLSRRHTILTIDDDPGTRECILWALSLAGMDVTSAESAAAGLGAARLSRFDLMIVDQRLPDVAGTELIRSMQHEGLMSPFLLLSAFLTTAITVEAMKLGAIDVIEKPVDIDDLVPIVSRALDDGQVGERRSVQARSTRETHDSLAGARGRPGSAAERWALHVFRACESPRDLKTLEDWAAYIGVSYSSLRESCHLLGVSAHDARDLMRVLRAVLKSRLHRCRPEVLLDISDGRTLQKLLRRAGFSAKAGDTVTPQQFLRDQLFVSREHAALRILMMYVWQQGTR